VKAVLIAEPHQVSVERIDDPTPGPGEAIVRVEACGICGTDIHVLEGDFAPTRYPIVPGHEFCGETVSVGSEVRNVKPGDFVAVDPSLFCGKCYVGSMAVLHSFERARDLLVKGTIDCEAMLTHRFPLDSYTTAIDTFRKGTGLKVQVTPNGSSV
jgi:threonine dehydrogenase-like Zn-dependent dehydrogenase